MALLLVLLMIVALLAAGFSAGTETGFTSVSRGRVLHMARKGGARAKVVEDAIANLERTLTTLLVGNNLAAVTYSSVSAALAAAYLPQNAAVQSAWSVFAAFLMLYAGEFMPKLLCSARPLRRTLQGVPIWLWERRMLRPLVAVIEFSISWLLPKRVKRSRITPMTVLKILGDRKNGVCLSSLESALIGRLMILRSQNREVTPDELLKVLEEPERK